MTAKYQLAGAEDVDLTRHVRTPAGVRYFHKPIGSPIGGSGRGTSKVSLKQGSAADSIFHDMQRVITRADAAARMYGTGSKQHLAAQRMSSANVTAPVVRLRAAGAPSATEAISSLGSKPRPDKRVDRLQTAISQAGPGDAEAQAMKKWWDEHRLAREDSVSLSKDLGLDPQFNDKLGNPISIKELRKRATDKKGTDASRQAAKAELLKRVQIANRAVEEEKSWRAKLAAQLGDKPKDADLAPIIGETLAAHPGLGALAHVWDRMRVTRYKFKHGLPWTDVFKDKGGDVLRGVGTVLLSGLLIHLGLPAIGVGG